METYTFYPKDNSDTQHNVNAPAGGTKGAFGCIETNAGVYVPTPDQKIIDAVNAANPPVHGASIWL